MLKKRNGVTTTGFSWFYPGVVVRDCHSSPWEAVYSLSYQPAVSREPSFIIRPSIIFLKEEISGIFISVDRIQ